jgi:hypothetical protein
MQNWGFSHNKYRIIISNNFKIIKARDFLFSKGK